MLELSTSELVAFAEKWRTDPKFKSTVQECLEYVERTETEIDLIPDEFASFKIQVTLRDARGPFFTDLINIRAGMDVDGVFSRAIAKARRGRVRSVVGTNKTITARSLPEYGAASALERLNAA